MAEYDPSEYTVDQVNDYLDDHPEEAGAVLALEADSDNPRVGITEGRHAVSEPSADQVDPESTDVTRGLETPPTGLPDHLDTVTTVEEANAAALAGDHDEATASTQEEADKLGYLGTSPGHVLTGLPDDGLSLPSVLGDQYQGEVQSPQGTERPEGSYDSTTGEFTPAPETQGDLTDED